MIIALNHKSNLEKDEYQEYLDKFSKIDTKHQLILCPSIIHIAQKHPENAMLGSQNVSAYNSGAHTGEISPQQLQSYHVQYTIVGHSERRMEQKEDLDSIHNKMIILQNNHITPILCVGETKEERAKGKVEEVLKKEIETATKDLQNDYIIAYEPI